jgi:hypothetical protein
VGATALTDGDPGPMPKGPEAQASGELRGGYAGRARESSPGGVSPYPAFATISAPIQPLIAAAAVPAAFSLP